MRRDSKGDVGPLFPQLPKDFFYQGFLTHFEYLDSLGS